MAQRWPARKTLALVLDNLERRGLVERRRHPTDRRRLTVHLRAADLLLVHLASREELATKLSEFESEGPEGLLEAL